MSVTNDSGSAGSAYLGPTPGSTAQAFSSSNGIPVPAGQTLTFANYNSSPATPMSVIAASTATVGYLISTDR